MSDENSVNNLISGNLTIRQALEQFLLTKKSESRARKTIEFYEDENRHFAKWAAGQGIRYVLDLTPPLIRLYLEHMAETRNKGGVHASWRALRAMLNWYEGEIEPEGWNNPVAKVKVPNPRPKALPGVPMDDYKKLVAACQGGRTWQRDRAILYCLLDSCARATEFINLNIKDVDLVTGDVLIRAGKGDETRYVQFGSTARKELRKYLKTRKSLSKSDPLFTTLEGERFGYQGLVSLVRWRSTQAKVPQPGLHDIRRGGALEMLRNGADVSEISIYLGHKSIEVTMRYLAISSDDLRTMHRKASPVNNTF